ncbi:Bidirectional sugar transporter sweet15 [Thalictrum thalictroides]|uniref:Bidirectional sugar transporter SWEET n=1 Tax=Thalictrum thalictroides TaxID=46969 RepID=A0A7J6WF86_THATH|nr:Bidirectional sugar transporter sweet15 [Thalictrum thalictroides]
MAIFTIHQHPWAFSFGVIGNLISLMVYLAPLSTFYRVYKKKSTEGFQSVPYVVALFSAMLWIYYAFLKSEAYLLITINSFGCFIETIYLVMYMVYAPRKAKLLTAKLLLLLNLGLFSLIFLLTFLLAEGPNRVRILGWVCVAFSACVFAAPLSIMRIVIRTKSVEFMPFYLSFFLTLSAIVWFSYGLFMKDFYIMLPNILGFIFGVLQMALYVAYKNTAKNDVNVEEDNKQPEHIIIDVVKITTITCNEIHPIDSVIQVMEDESIICKDEKAHEQTDQNEISMRSPK